MTESTFALLDGYGLGTGEMLDIWRTVLAFVQGYVFAEARRLEAGPRAATPEPGDAPSYLDRVAESGEYPLTVRALREDGPAADPGEVFERRLGYVLDGLACTFFADTPPE
jgi:hypothetical protein